MSDYYMIDGELYHAGKKGMKWGYNDGKKKTVKELRMRTLYRSCQWTESL